MPSKSILPTLVAVGALFGAAGCPLDEPPEIRIVDMGPDGGPDASQGPAALQQATRAWLASARANRWRYFRFVEVCVPEDCVLDGAGWQTSRLFEPGAAGAEAPDDRRPPGGVADADSRYMLFEWTMPDGLDEAQADQARADAAGVLDTLHGVSGINLETAELYPSRVNRLADPDQLRGRDSVRWRRLGGARRSPLEGAPDQVRVVVLDTAPAMDLRELFATDRADWAGAGRAAHGLDLAVAVHEAACGYERVGEPVAGCPVEVVTQLALDLATAIPETEDEGAPAEFGGFERRPDGGHFGDPGGVARALWLATRDWSQAQPAQRPALVLTLALGWPDADERSPSSEAVKLALDYARCHGALAVPAYGNVSVPAGMGSLRPAAFGQPGDCAALAGVDGVAAPAVTVAGADLLGRGDRDLDPAIGPLGNARAWGAAPPQAFAWGEGVRIPNGTARWTGSSMAAGMYSAAAAVEWLSEAQSRGAPPGVIGAQSVVDALHQRTLAQGQIVRPCAAAGGQCTEALPPFELDAMMATPAVEPVPEGCGGQGQDPCDNALWERADPQPDEPVCDVCAVSPVAGAAQAADFTLLAKNAPWPAFKDRITSAYLKITYTSTNDVTVAPLNLDALRYEIDGSNTMEVYEASGVSLDAPYSKISGVTVVGTKQGPYDSQPKVFAESVFVDP